MSTIEKPSQITQLLAEGGPAPLPTLAGRYRLLNNEVKNEIELDTTPIGYRDFEKRIGSRHKRGFSYILAVITNKVERIANEVTTTSEVKQYSDAAELHNWRHQAQKNGNNFTNPLSGKKIEKIEYFFSTSLIPCSLNRYFLSIFPIKPPMKKRRNSRF
jgi:hypothetical protein